MARRAHIRVALTLVVAVCVWLPELVLGWRSENEAGYQSGGSSNTRALHIRVDGKQTRLKPLVMSPGDDGDKPVEAPVADASLQKQKGVSAKVIAAIRTERRTFLESLDPRNGSIMVWFMWGMLAFALSIAFVAAYRAICGNGGSDAMEEGEKQGAGITNGSELVCTCRDMEDLAKVYAEIGSSDEVLRQVEFAETIVAAGPTQDVAGCVLVPIQPEGFVRLAHFTVEKAVLVKPGTVLTCTRTEGQVHVFMNARSNFILGKINKGEKVVVQKLPEMCHGWTMVPIRPQGAVELEFFDVEQLDEDHEVDDAVAAWARSHTADLEANGEVSQKLKALRAQKTKLLIDQASRKNKIDKIVEEMAEHEAELHGKSAPTDAEIKKTAEKAMLKSDMAAHRNILMAVAYAAPLVTQSQRIYQAVEKTKQKVRERGSQIALEESKQTLKDLQHIFGFEDAEALTDGIDSINIPSVAAILACVFAPMQIRLVFALNFLFFSMSLLNVVMDIGVLVFDWHTPCMSNPLPEPPAGAPWQDWAKVWWEDALLSPMYSWFLVDCAVHLGCLMTRIPVVLRLKRIIATMVTPPQTAADIDPIEALKIYHEYYTTTGTNALVTLDAALSSYMIFLANLSVIFDVCWLFFGTDVVWNTPWGTCHSTGIAILRLRVSIFQILFIVYGLQLGIFASGQLLQSEKFAVRVIEAADRWDKNMFLTGLPVMKVIAHALIVRRSSDMIAIQMNMQLVERNRLQDDIDEAKAKLELIVSSCDEAEQAIEELQHEKLLTGGPWKDHAEMQEQYDKMHSEIKEGSAVFAKQVRVRSTQATENAEQQLEQWERGEGGGEVIRAIFNGEGLAKTVDGTGISAVLPPESLQAGFEQVQTTAAASSEVATVLPTAAAPLQPASAASSAEDAAGGPAAAAPQAPLAPMPTPVRRGSQADAGAGGPAGAGFM